MQYRTWVNRILCACKYHVNAFNMAFTRAMNPLGALAGESLPFFPHITNESSALERENRQNIVVVKMLRRAHTCRIWSRRPSKCMRVETRCKRLHKMRRRFDGIARFGRAESQKHRSASTEKEALSLITAGQAPKRENTPWLTKRGLRIRSQPPELWSHSFA